MLPVYEEYVEDYTDRAPVRPPLRRRQRDSSSRVLVHKRNMGLPERDAPDDYDPNRIYEENEELPPGLHVVKKGKTSRRRLLVGVGAGVLVVGSIVAVSKLASQEVPQEDHTA